MGVNLKKLLSFALLLNIATGFTAIYTNCSEHGQVKDKSECPPWFKADKGGICQPGPQLGGIIQQDLSTLQTSVSECVCMTEDNGTLSVGSCLYTCAALNFNGYYPLPCHAAELQNFTCSDFNRYGPLCGQCMEGYAIPVYSYCLHCVRCENYQYNWLKYLAVAFLPLTLFYIIVTLFSISFTSPLLSGVVLVFQIGANPIQLYIISSLVEAGTIIAPMPLKLILSIASLFNLDFFRLFYRFCVHPDASAMDILLLDYALAVYPIFLIGITYVMVKLHDYNFKLLVWLWKPFKCILTPLKKQWNMRTSLVDVFASFIYLSSSRLLWTSAEFLVPIRVYHYQQEADIHSQMSAKLYVFISPSVEYFSLKHLPFVILATTVLFLLFILPMLLLFMYPFYFFQNILNKVGMNSLVLHTFMEVFQGHYKDGTNGTKNYQYFSGFLLLLPFLITLTFSLTQSSYYYVFATIWILLYLVVHIAFQPFKRHSHNQIMILMSASILMSYLGVVLNGDIVARPVQSEYLNRCLTVSFVLMGISIPFPLIYLLVLTLPVTRIIRRS